MCGSASTTRPGGRRRTTGRCLVAATNSTTEPALRFNPTIRTPEPPQPLGECLFSVDADPPLATTHPCLRFAWPIPTRLGPQDAEEQLDQRPADRPREWACWAGQASDGQNCKGQSERQQKREQNSSPEGRVLQSSSRMNLTGPPESPSGSPDGARGLRCFEETGAHHSPSVQQGGQIVVGAAAPRTGSGDGFRGCVVPGQRTAVRGATQKLSLRFIPWE